MSAHPPAEGRNPLSAAIAPFVLAAASTVFCYFTTGATLGLFFGGVVIVTILVPFLALGETHSFRRFVAFATVVDTVAIVWLLALSRVTFMEWLEAYLLLTCYGFALLGLAILLCEAGISSIFASTIVTILALLWLSWPIWLSPWTAGRNNLVAWLSVLHPLLSLDGALLPLGTPWPQAPLMYRYLSNLNQDVIYHPPRNVLWAVMLHAVIGGAALLAGQSLRVHSERSRAGPTASESGGR